MFFQISGISYFLKGEIIMTKWITGLLSAVAVSAMLASCSGNVSDSSREDGDVTTTTTTTRRSETVTSTGTDSEPLMSKVESKADQLGEDVADGIDATLSTAGDVADDILR